MADTDVSREDRQLPASQRRLDQAAADGRVARSRDAGHALLIGSALLIFSMLGPALASSAVELVRGGLKLDPALVLEPVRMADRLHLLVTTAWSAAWPTLASFALVGAIASVIPGGPAFSTKPIGFDFGRISPAAGLGRLLSKNAFVDAMKLLALTASLGIAAWLFIGGNVGRFAGIADLPLAGALASGMDTLSGGLSALAGVLLVVALFDAPMQWFRLRGELRMTHQEVREEARQAEGDPQSKGRMRARQREIGRSRMLSAVPSADVVITNPTHYAVAIRYDESRMGAPRVVAKGADLVAARIRELAIECGVPLLEAPPLARALYANVEIDREIPAALYGAVAQVLAYVFQLRHFVPGRDRAPNPPSGIDVPADLDPSNRTS